MFAVCGKEFLERVALFGDREEAPQVIVLFIRSALLVRMPPLRKDVRASWIPEDGVNSCFRVDYCLLVEVMEPPVVPPWSLVADVENPNLFGLGRRPLACWASAPDLPRSGSYLGALLPSANPSAVAPPPPCVLPYSNPILPTPRALVDWVPGLPERLICLFPVT